MHKRINFLRGIKMKGGKFAKKKGDRFER